MKSKQPQERQRDQRPQQSGQPQESQDSQGARRLALMWTLAIANQKGGTGKTTTAVNLAAGLGELGQRVLLVDLDPQGDATTALGLKDEGDKGLLEVFMEGRLLETLVRPTKTPGVDVVPGSQHLLERTLAGEPGVDHALRAAFEQLSPRWDVVVVDCPPSLGLVAIAALVGCSQYLVPVATEYLALKGLAALGRTIGKVHQKHLNPGLRLAGVLPCFMDSRTRIAAEIVTTLRERYPDECYQTVIRRNVRFREAPGHGQPITLYDPTGPGAEDYRALAREVLGRWSQQRRQSQDSQDSQGARG